jgi:hypothetical protein
MHFDKNGWATFWAIFSQTQLATLVLMVILQSNVQMLEFSTNYA